MPSRKFKTKDLQSLVWDDYDNDFDLEVIEDKISDTGRWSIYHSLVFKNKSDNKFYKTSYSVGATESQDESPFEYEGEEVSCTEVEPVEKVIIVYKEVK